MSRAGHPTSERELLAAEEQERDTNRRRVNAAMEEERTAALLRQRIELTGSMDEVMQLRAQLRGGRLAAQALCRGPA